MLSASLADTAIALAPLAVGMPTTATGGKDEPGGFGVDVAEPLPSWPL
jgi:hypothetical protein